MLWFILGFLVLGFFVLLFFMLMGFMECFVGGFVWCLFVVILVFVFNGLVFGKDVVFFGVFGFYFGM